MSAVWAKLVASVVGFIRALLPFLAYLAGKSAGKKEAVAEQATANAELQKKYAEIATQGIDDDEVDRRLDEGSI